MLTERPYGIMEFAAKLRDLLKDRGLSQDDLAIAVDVSQSQVSKWCRGVNTPDIHQGATIARELGVSLDFLLDDDLDEPPAPELTEDERAILRVVRASGLGFDEVIRRITAANSPPLSGGEAIEPSKPGRAGQRRA